MSKRTPTYKRDLRIAPCFDDYNIHLSDGWAKLACKSSKPLQPLYVATFDFASEMRAIAHTARLPYELLRNLEGFYAGMMKREDSEASSERAGRAIVLNASRRIKSLNAEQLKELDQVFQGIQLGLPRVREKAVQAFPLQLFWEMLLSAPQFQLSLWGSQRLAYVAVYNAYESYLTRCIGIAKGQPKYRLKPHKTADDIESSFGASVLQTCWTSSKLEIPRLVRHALSHAAGRETDHLRNKAAGDVVVGGEVHPTAHHVQELIVTTEESGMKLIDAVLLSAGSKKD